MFVTKAAFEHHVPRELAEPGSRYHLAVLLSNEGPWYLVTFRAKAADMSLQQTIAVSWESTLIQLVRDLGADAILSIRTVHPVRSGESSWAMKEVAALWLPLAEEEEETGPLLFAIADVPGLFNSFVFTPAAKRSGRQLLWAQLKR